MNSGGMIGWLSRSMAAWLDASCLDASYSIRGGNWINGVAVRTRQDIVAMCVNICIVEFGCLKIRSKLMYGSNNIIHIYTDQRSGLTFRRVCKISKTNVHIFFYYKNKF